MVRSRSYSHLSPSKRGKLMHVIGECPDVNHDLLKTRLGQDGKPISSVAKGKELTGDAERIARQKSEGYCKSRLLSSVLLE